MLRLDCNHPNPHEDTHEKFILLSCEERDISKILSHSDLLPNTVIRFVRGIRCLSQERFFQECAAALQFPWYFGENWDAFDECIADLDWLPATNYIIFMTQANNILNSNIRDFQILLTILRDVRKEWSDQYVGFHVLFQCEPMHEEQVIKRFTEFGFTLTVLKDNQSDA